MVRYTIALRGLPKSENAAIMIEEKSVDIFHEEQLSEDFLCNINAKGQVREYLLLDGQAVDSMLGPCSHLIGA